MKPIVGISLSDFDAAVKIFYLACDLGIRALLFDHANKSRWQLLINNVGRNSVVCIVDDDPETVVAATSLGLNAMVFQPPPWFSWHLTMCDTGADAQAALAYRLKEWEGRHATDQA